MVRAAYGIGALLAGVAAVLAAEPAIKMVAYRDLLIAKRGRVIDEATGEGIPGVTVTLKVMSGGGGAAGSFGGCDFQYVVTTDAQGDYAIPMQWDPVRFQRIGWKPLAAPLVGLASPYIGYNWTLVSWKAGYVRVGDENGIRNAVVAERQPDRSFPFYRNAPPPHAGVAGIEVAPIPLRAADLDPIDEIVYDDAILIAATCSGYPPVRERMKARVRELPCAMPAERALSPGVVRAYAHVAGDEDFFGRMRSMTATERWSRRAELAGTLCRAIGARE